MGWCAGIPRIPLCHSNKLQQLLWATKVGQYTADQLAEEVKKRSDTDAVETRRKALLARCRANMSESNASTLFLL